jgi:hypothetical protein
MSEYKMVPVEPTPSMVYAAMREVGITGPHAEVVIKAAIAAAPPAPVVGEPVAWRYRYVGPSLQAPGPWRVREEPPADEELQPAFYEFVPLYAHPPATSPERDRALREAVQLIRANMIVHSSSEADYLAPRRDGDRQGMAYAEAIEMMIGTPSPEREEALVLAAWCRDEMQGYVKNAPTHAVLGRIEALLRRIAGGA